MRKPIILSVLALTLNAAHAAEPASVYCKRIGELAHEVMGDRQTERPLSTSLEAALPLSFKYSLDRKLIERVIIEAYEASTVSSDAYQMKQRARFRNEFELACFKNMK